MSAMVKNGDLVPDAAGTITKQQTFDALMHVGVSRRVAEETTNANFDHLPWPKRLKPRRHVAHSRHRRPPHVCWWPHSSLHLSACSCFPIGYRNRSAGSLVLLPRQAAGKMQAFRKIVASIVRSAMSVASMGVLLLLFIYSSAIVGMQLMQGAWPRDERPRFHFDNFPSAFVTVWCVVTTEEWNIIMMEAYSVVGWWAIFYFVAVVIVGNFIFLNMFIS